jgi:CheY-like chemotaxis protein
MPRVLYIEHDEDNLFMLKMRLERADDFEVIASNDIEQGCKLAVTERPDIILMDLEMPVEDRWEVVRRLKRMPKLAIPRSSACPLTRWRASVRKPSPVAATNSMPNRSSLRLWSPPFGASSRTRNNPSGAGQDGLPPGSRTVNKHGVEYRLQLAGRA